MGKARGAPRESGQLEKPLAESLHFPLHLPTTPHHQDQEESLPCKGPHRHGHFLILIGPVAGPSSLQDLVPEQQQPSGSDCTTQSLTAPTILRLSPEFAFLGFLLSGHLHDSRSRAACLWTLTGQEHLCHTSGGGCLSPELPTG